MTPRWLTEFHHFLFMKASYLLPEELIEGQSVISQKLKDDILIYSKEKGLTIHNDGDNFIIHQGNMESEGVRIDSHLFSDKAFSLKIYVEKEYAHAPDTAKKNKP